LLQSALRGIQTFPFKSPPSDNLLIVLWALKKSVLPSSEALEG
jgi:hypothetical protein